MTRKWITLAAGARGPDIQDRNQLCSVEHDRGGSLNRDHTIVSLFDGMWYVMAGYGEGWRKKGKK